MFSVRFLKISYAGLVTPSNSDTPIAPIRAKKKQIALLQEQKQAIINQAVTKGLNPNAEMKDSGIDWLGQIPAKWAVKPLKRVCKVNAGVGHLSKKLSDDALVTFLPMENISVDGKIDCSHVYDFKKSSSF